MSIIHLEKENFAELIKEEVLVDFYANWCGPCKMLAPILEEVGNYFKVIKVDIDKHDDLAHRYGVMSIPTLILFKDGVEIKRHVGFLNKDALLEFISK